MLEPDPDGDPGNPNDIFNCFLYNLRHVLKISSKSVYALFRNAANRHVPPPPQSPQNMKNSPGSWSWFAIPLNNHYSDVIMGWIASQITSLTIVYSSVYSGAEQRKHQNSASLAFVRGNHRRPVNSPHKGPVTRQMFPFDDVIMTVYCIITYLSVEFYEITFKVYPQGF